MMTNSQNINNYDRFDLSYELTHQMYQQYENQTEMLYYVILPTTNYNQFHSKVNTRENIYTLFPFLEGHDSNKYMTMYTLLVNLFFIITMYSYVRSRCLQVQTCVCKLI